MVLQQTTIEKANNESNEHQMLLPPPPDLCWQSRRQRASSFNLVWGSFRIVARSERVTLSYFPSNDFLTRESFM